MIRVFVVDSKPVFCDGIQAAVETTTDLQWLGAATSFNQFCAYPVNRPPNVVLAAAAADDAFLETITAWKRQNKESNVLAILSHPAELCLRQATAQGITGCILRTDAPERFIQAIRAVAAGEEWFSRQLLQETVHTQILATPENATGQLTEEEITIVQLICAEKSNAEIAVAINVSERTVCRYLEDIYLKLGVSSRVGAAVQATKMGLA